MKSFPLHNMDVRHRHLHMQGYTLIELIVVIVVLSILSYTAWSKMTDTDARARATALIAFKAAVSATANMAKGMCLTDTTCNPNSPNGTSSVIVSGQTIFVHFGYPIGWLAGDTQGEGTLDGMLNASDFTIQPALSSTTRAVYYLRTARDASRCSLTYQLTNSNFSPVMSITTDSSGC